MTSISYKYQIVPIRALYCPAYSAYSGDAVPKTLPARALFDMGSLARVPEKPTSGSGAVPPGDTSYVYMYIHAYIYIYIYPQGIVNRD